jgi:hypothetical protein
MFNAEEYIDIFYTTICIIILITFFHYSFSSANKKLSSNVVDILTFLLILLPITLFLGFRPVSAVFGDMLNYHRHFNEISYNKDIFYGSDIIFTKYIELSTSLVGVEFWFFLTSLIIIGFQFWATKRIFTKDRYLYFLALLGSLTLYSSVINGIRSGMAISIFLFALSFRSKPIRMYLLFALSIGIHKSLMLPALAYLITIFYSNTKVLVRIWFSAVLLSFFMGNYISDFFNNLNFNLIDNRIDNYLLVDADVNKFSSVGFRYDFVIYSIIPMFYWYMYYLRKQIKVSLLYKMLLNVYIVSNTFWVILMYVNYANRFASLSWFLWPFLVLFPILENTENRNSKIQAIMVIFGQTILSYFIQK